MGRGSDGTNPQDTGLRAYREPDEPPDGRPVIVRDGFWRDGMEQAVYEEAVRSNPRNPGEGPMAYIERIARLVADDPSSPIKNMPRRRMSQREWERRQHDVKMRAAGDVESRKG